MSPLFRPFSRLSATAARICRCGALMFALLLAIPLMPLAERGWMMIALLGLFAILVYLILRDAVELGRTRAWLDPVEPGAARGASARHARPAHGSPAHQAPAHEESMDWDRVQIPSSASSTASRHQDRRPGPASPPRRDALVWADEPGAVRATPGPPAPVAPAASSGPGVTIEVRAFKDGVVDLDLRAADGSSAASTRIAEPLERALRFGDALRGFTGQSSDRRDAQLGSFDPAERSGGLRVVLFNREGQGRAYITVWPDTPDSAGFRQTTSLAFDVDAAEVRAFANALSAAVLSPGSRVVLPTAQSR